MSKLCIIFWEMNYKQLYNIYIYSYTFMQYKFYEEKIKIKGLEENDMGVILGMLVRADTVRR